MFSGIISVTLNVKYMLDWKPAGTFGLIIAVVVGILIPLMVCLFGWLEKAMVEQNATNISNGKLKDIISFHLEKYGEKSNREIADLVGCSHTTVARYRKELSNANNR